jgi:hypothetical protein
VKQDDRKRAGANAGIASAEVVKSVGKGAGFVRREKLVKRGALGGVNAVGGVEGEELPDAGGPVLWRSCVRENAAIFTPG